MFMFNYLDGFVTLNQDEEEERRKSIENSFLATVKSHFKGIKTIEEKNIYLKAEAKYQVRVRNMYSTLSIGMDNIFRLDGFLTLI